ncbi:hypothetical protein BpHYR1_028730 [Brachionus plicatilis]|uniref:RNA methyltransferase n=1 Tax=Brachionus plicatilis TaxID=10195 RepID=A0A3M7PK35_BRAPC|nr:hypothetical protein BpHYR1_028730 [Brachionus plicatilis]
MSKAEIKRKQNSEHNREKKIPRKNENDSKTDSDFSDDQIDPSKDVVFNMPKPGPHAKAGEWRKWKMMKRTIRQQREEKKILKAKEIETKKKNLEEYTKTSPEEKKGRSFTLSIAIPGSIMSKVPSKELKTYVAGQIGRAAALFCVDEIIVYNEYAIENKQHNDYNEQLIKILEYLECPQYLRKALFPPHKYLEHVGLLHPLEAHHHFKLNDHWEYRDGVVTDIPSKDGKGSWVDIGLLNKIEIDKKLQPGIRVTVKKLVADSGKIKGKVVSPETPRVESGLYWGYQVRYAGSFRKIIFESSFKGNYDLKISINLNANQLNLESIDKLPSAKRVLIVFGGVNGIEPAIEADEKLKANKLEQIFDFVCESKDADQKYGSRSIRLEEAILVSLAVLRPKFFEAMEEENFEKENKENEERSESNDSEDEENNEKNDLKIEENSEI